MNYDQWKLATPPYLEDPPVELERIMEDAEQEAANLLLPIPEVDEDFVVELEQGVPVLKVRIDLDLDASDPDVIGEEMVQQLRDLADRIELLS